MKASKEKVCQFRVLGDEVVDLKTKWWRATCGNNTSDESSILGIFKSCNVNSHDGLCSGEVYLFSQKISVNVSGAKAVEFKELTEFLLAFISINMLNSLSRAEVS